MTAMLELRYAELDNLAQKVRAKLEKLPAYVMQNYSRDFDIRYAHESTAIEGNTLTLREVSLLLNDKISVGGKTLREIYEVTNHDKAFSYVRRRFLSVKKTELFHVKHLILRFNRER